MKKTFRTLLIIFGIILLIAAGMAVYLYANKSLIKNYFIDKVNAQLDAKIAIANIELSLFSQFPKVSLDLNDVKISDPLSEKKILLRAQHIFIGFNLYDILSENYNIKQITIDSGTCNIFCDKKGKYNFYILKTDTTKKKQENIFLQLKNIRVNKTIFNYTDLESNQLYRMVLNNVAMSGSFTEKSVDFTCNGNLFVQKFKTGSVNLIKEKNVHLDLILGVDRITKHFLIKKGLVDLDDLKLEAEGIIEDNPKDIYVDIRFKARQLSIQSLLSLMPVKVNAVQEYKSSGEIYFKGTAKGIISAKEQAAIQVDFGIKNGTLNRSSNNLEIDKINFMGHFSNGAKKTMESSTLEVKSLSMLIKNEIITGDLTISNFTHPFIDATLKGQLEASQLISIINNKNIKSADGNVLFNIKISGNANDFSDKNNWTKTHSSGNFEIDLQHIIIANAQKEIESIHASLTLQQNDLLINSFQSKVQQSDITIKGKLINVVPYFLLDKQKLEMDIDYSSDYIDLNHFMMPSSPEENKKETALQLPENILLHAKLKVSKLDFHEFNATNVNALITWKEKKIIIENLSCQTMNGNITASGQVEKASDGRFLITSTSTLKNININELFRQCNNFGQNELTNKHLNGVVNATFDVASVWSAKMDCDLSRLYAFGDIQLLNGEILGYKPFEALSKYADVEDLRHIRFAELKNKIEIKNKTINIPGMDIKSNALNLTLSGTHTFENYVDYKLKLKLSELLKKKRKPQQNEFGEEEDESGKGLYLYLSMKGPIDNPKFSYDKAGVKNKMKQDIKIEKQNIREVLKKELGIGKDSTIKEKKNDNEELEFEKE